MSRWVWQIAALVVATGIVLLGLVVFRGGDEPVSTVGATDRGTAGETVPAASTELSASPPTPTTHPAVESTTSVSVPDTDPATFFVSSSAGSDDNDGQTAEAPWQSLQTSLDRLEPGQTLYLMDGEYTETVDPGYAHYLMTVSGAPDAWIRIAAAAGHEPRLVPTAGNGLVIKANYIRIEGLTVRGEQFGVDNPYGWGLLVSGAHHVTLTGNTISDMPVGGISAASSANVTISDNEIFDNSFWGTEQGSGISVWHARDHGTEPDEDGYHDRIISNTVYRNENKVFSRWAPGQQLITDGNGIIVDESIETGYTGHTLVANNVVFDNGGRAIMVNKATDVDVVFNTTYQNSRTDDLAGGPVEFGVRRSERIRILNNLAWARDGMPGLRVAENEGLELAGNVFVTGAPTGAETSRDLVTTESPGLVAPSVDPVSADFRPGPGSILIDLASVGAPSVGVDAVGNSRPTENADVGAYEFVSP